MTDAKLDEQMVEETRKESSPSTNYNTCTSSRVQN